MFHNYEFFSRFPALQCLPFERFFQERALPFEGEKFFSQCKDASKRPALPESGLLNPAEVKLVYVILAHDEPDQVVRCEVDGSLCITSYFVLVLLRIGVCRRQYQRHVIPKVRYLSGTNPCCTLDDGSAPYL